LLGASGWCAVCGVCICFSGKTCIKVYGVRGKGRCLLKKKEERMPQSIFKVDSDILIKDVQEIATVVIPINHQEKMQYAERMKKIT
jgi:hypothetical protein